MGRSFQSVKLVSVPPFWACLISTPPETIRVFLFEKGSFIDLRQLHQDDTIILRSNPTSA
jgi:hypothetical protein